jgi:hypothetical protein
MLIFCDSSEPLLSKVNAADVVFYRWAFFVQSGLQMISDMPMRIYSSASIAENSLLSAAVFVRP